MRGKKENTGVVRVERNFKLVQNRKVLKMGEREKFQQIPEEQWNRQQHRQSYASLFQTCYVLTFQSFLIVIKDCFQINQTIQHKWKYISNLICGPLSHFKPLLCQWFSHITCFLSQNVITVYRRFLLMNIGAWVWIRAVYYVGSYNRSARNLWRKEEDKKSCKLSVKNLS